MDDDDLLLAMYSGTEDVSVPIRKNIENINEQKDSKKNVEILSRLEQRIRTLENKLKLNENRIRLLQSEMQQKNNQIRSLKDELSTKIGYE